MVVAVLFGGQTMLPLLFLLGKPPTHSATPSPTIHPRLQVAGSADGFRKVDLDYVAASARAASAGGASHFSLVSAQGAKAGVWASDLKPFHGLLYMKVKGQVRSSAGGRKSGALLWVGSCCDNPTCNRAAAWDVLAAFLLP